jgi:hypothetical protein
MYPDGAFQRQTYATTRARSAIPSGPDASVPGGPPGNGCDGAPIAAA